MGEGIDGRVLLASSNRALVSTADGVVSCRLMGRLRRGEDRVMTGDRVILRLLPDEESGMIETVLPRKNHLSRPPIANVDQVVVLATLREPPLNASLVDRLLVSAEHQGIGAVLALGKVDLVEQEDRDAFKSRFHQTGYIIVEVSSLTGSGREEVLDLLRSKVSVLAGETGVGKSSLLNLLLPGAQLRTGPVDPRSGRGRHVTREVRLLQLPQGGLVADSPGFMRVDVPDLLKEEIGECFPEIRRVDGCKFRNCLHLTEPGCMVREALKESRIHPDRYRTYTQLVQEAIEREEDLY